MLRKRFSVVCITLFAVLLTAVDANATPINPTRDPVTTSERINIADGDTYARRELEIPDCAPQSEFKFQQVVAYPRPTSLETDPETRAEIDVDLGKWYVLVPLGQPYPLGDNVAESGVQLYLYGEGYETASASINPGQAVLESGLSFPSVSVRVGLIESGGGRHEFVVHLSGRCEDPFVLTQSPDAGEL